jgi:hypothetical protein
MCGSELVLGQQNKVFQSHPFDLNIEAAIPAPFQFQPYDSSQYLPCCPVFRMPGYTNFSPGLFLGNQWAGIPYRQNFYVLDGSTTDSHRKVYRAGSMYYRTTFVEGIFGNQEVIQDRLIILPGY